MPELDNGPGVQYASVTPADSDIADFRGIYVGETGDVVVKGLDGTIVTFSNLAAGVIHPIGGKRIGLASTATSILVIR